MTDDPFDGDHGPRCTCDADLAERWHMERELDAADAADRDEGCDDGGDPEDVEAWR